MRSNKDKPRGEKLGTAELHSSRPGVDPRFERVYQSEIHSLLLERLRLALGVGIPIYGGFWFMDLVLAPTLGTEFLLIRSAVVLLAAGTIWLTYTRFGERYLVSMSVTMITAAALGISLMTMLVGGFASDYYYGHLLILFLIGLFLPWRPAIAMLFSVLLVAGYFGLNLAAHGAGAEMIAPSFFLIATCIFTCLATAVGDRLRRRDLALRRKLERANEDLKKLDEAKTAFFANVSHELRTPLTLMLGPVETMLQAAGSEERKTLLRAVLANTHRLLRHVNLLLDTAKLEAGQLQLDLIEGSLTNLLDDLVTASLPHAGRKGIQIQTEGFEGIPEFAFDPDKVEMIAANLLSNALKFTPDGGRIVVDTRADEKAVVLEVEDNGPGIPEQEREQIFDRFHQVDSSLTRREEGTGLGLTLARELARLHGGELIVDSEVGRGSVFRLSLPREARPSAERRLRPRRQEDKMVRARADALTQREYTRRSRQETLLADVRQPRLRSLARHETPADAPTILVVDDNADLRSYLASELSREYRVETAADGVEGLKKALQLRPKLVIADVMMPGMNGYELCRRLRAEPMLKSLPVILVTAKAGSEAVVEGLGVGADDYVTKPFSMEELEARVAAQLRAKRMEKELGERETRLAAIGSLTSTVVHDLRNALTLITGYSDLAHSIAVGGGRQEELVADIEQVQAASQRLERMTNEILEYARGGGMALDLSKLPATDYLRGILDPFRKHLAGQGVELREESDLRPDTTVELDADRFARVLENLLGNARDAMAGQTGDQIVYVRAYVERDSFCVRVADSGPGIPNERIATLFEPFATGKRRGTGLGLVTVRNLVRAHGGRVDVEASSPEGGAAFIVAVPLESRATPAAEDRLAGFAAPTSAPN